jgi:His-Xaa-Ser system protein HxsD
MSEERLVEIEVEGGVARVRAPAGFNLAAALRAAYYRIGRFHVAVDVDGESPVISLRPRESLAEEALVEAAERLAQDLPDAELRTSLLADNAAEREYLFARALFGAEAAEQERMLAELAAAGSGDDPLGIAVPWEEKYAKPPK